MITTYKNAVKRISFFTVIALFLSVFSAYANDTARVERVSGYVTVTNKDGDVRRLNDGDTVNEGDVINTGNESSVTIVLANDEQVVLSALENYTVVAGIDTGGFAQRNLQGNIPNTLTGTTAGGVSASDTAPTTPDAGGSPVN